MIRELVLTSDVPEHGLKAGDVGTVALTHDSKAYEVEFMTLAGDTIAVISLDAKCVRAIAANEVPHARRVEAA